MFNIKKILGYVAAGLVGLVVISASIFGIIKLVTKDTPAAVDPEATEVEPGTARGEQINLQLPVNQWLDSNSISNNAGVVIYDIDHNAVVARHNEDAEFDMAQLYQLFVAYEGYYRIARGNWDGTTKYEDLDLDRATCLDYTLRWSYVECSDRLWDDIGRDNLQAIFEAKNYSATKINSFTSTPSEISSIMRLYNSHPNFSDSIWQTIRTALSDQGGNTTFDGINLRQGLPSGFAVATAYNKAGWYKTDSEAMLVECAEDDTECQKKKADAEPDWHTYDDAAIVEFSATKNNNGEEIPARHYVIVVMTRETSPRKIVTLGRNIEQFIRTADGY